MEGGGRSASGGARPGRGGRPRPGLAKGAGCAPLSPPPGSPSRRPAVRLHSAGAPGVLRAPGPRQPAKRRRKQRESERQRAPHPRAGTLSTLHSAFASSLVPSLRSPPETRGWSAGEGRKGSGVLEARETAGAELGNAPPARRSSTTPACGVPSPLRLSWQAGRQPAPSLSPARSSHASSADTANP